MGYIIFYSQSLDPENEVSIGSTNHTAHINNLDPNTLYKIRVSAYTSTAAGAASRAVLKRTASHGNDS